MVQLVGDVSSHGGFSEVGVEYATPRGDDLDTRLLRAMVVKGILEQITTANVNLVNADLLAKERGLRVVETKVPAGKSFFFFFPGGVFRLQKKKKGTPFFFSPELSLPPSSLSNPPLNQQLQEATPL